MILLTGLGIAKGPGIAFGRGQRSHLDFGEPHTRELVDQRNFGAVGITPGSF